MQPFVNTLLENIVFLMVLLPLVGVGILLCSARAPVRNIRLTALVNVLMSCGLAIGMVAHFQGAVSAEDGATSAAEPRMITQFRWLGSGPGGEANGPDIRLAFGVDGIGLWFVAMIPFVMLPALAAVRDGDLERPALFHALLLGTEATAITTFAARDVVLFLVGLETTLFLLFLLLGGWGGYDRRIAARKFLLYNLLGGLLISCGVIGLVLAEQRLRVSANRPAPTAHFSYEELLEPSPTLSSDLPLLLLRARISEANHKYWMGVAPWIFLALLLGFAIRTPIFPFHTWLTTANLEATTTASILLTAIQLPLGAYGLLRFVIPLFPEFCYVASDAIVGVCIFGAVYASLLALAQGDLKKIATYVCIADLGLCVAGLFSLNEPGATGAVLLLVSHSLAMTFFLAMTGVIEHRYRTRDIEPFGGLAAGYPRLGGTLAFAASALAGAPGLAGFVASTTMLLGLYHGIEEPFSHPWRTTAALAAGLLVAWASFGALGRMLHGRFREPGVGTIFTGDSNGSRIGRSREVADDESVVAVSFGTRSGSAKRDLAWNELLPLAPLAAALLWMGIAPQFFIERVEPTVGRLFSSYGPLRFSSPEHSARRSHSKSEKDLPDASSIRDTETVRDSFSTDRLPPVRRREQHAALHFKTPPVEIRPAAHIELAP